MALIDFTEKGLYCSAGGFYIDPWKPVDKAVITHAHSDHARWGNNHYLFHRHSLPIMKLRLGDISYETKEYDDPFHINGVKVSLHPAGHIIGSAQVRIEHEGEVWVISGDYKTEPDGVCEPFVPVKCNTFVTESTFGLPIYKWKPQHEIFKGLKNWVLKNNSAGITSVLIAYSLGKAQRILQPLAETGVPIYAHGAVFNVHDAFIKDGWKLPEVKRVSPETTKEELKGAVVIAPSGAEGSSWIRRFQPYAVGICSGWMQVRGSVRRKNADAGFVLSDHADWDGLISAVKETGASRVYTTHGFQSAFSRYLNENGIESGEIITSFGGEEEEETKSVE